MSTTASHKELINRGEFGRFSTEAKHPHCASCQSINQKTFTSEIAIHFPGLAGLNKPIVWVFPKISVCLDCGLARLAVPERELEVLRTGMPVEGAAVWLGNTKD